MPEQGENIWDAAVRDAMRMLKREIKKKHSFDEYRIRILLMKKWHLSKTEATNIIFEAADGDHLDLGDVPFSG